MIMNTKLALFFTFLLCCYQFNFATINTDQTISDIIFKGVANQTALSSLHELAISTKKNRRINPIKLQNDLELFYKTGYFYEIEATSISSSNRHILVFNFKENPIINQISILSGFKSTQATLNDYFATLKSSPLNSQTIEKIRLNVTKEMHSNGFDLFEISNIEFDKQAKQLNIYISEGIIESISINGLTTFDQTLILRDMRQQTGALFNSKTLRQDREMLLQLGYFSTVSAPKLSKGEDPSKIHISFDVTEKKSNRISLGIEQDQDDFYGFISRLRSNSLIKTDALSLKSQIQLSNNSIELNRYSVFYSQPWFLNKFNVKANLRIYNEEVQEILNNSSTSSLRQGLSFGFIFPIKPTIRLSTTLKKENISEGSSADDIDDYSINSLDLIFTYDTINNPINPSKGRKLQCNFEQGNDLGILNLGGLSFSKLTISGSQFFSLSKKLILGLQLKGGIFYPNDENIDTYENEYFELGGSTSLRGYYENNSIFTGTRQLLANLEFRYNLNKTIQIVTFSDFGNAFDGDIDFLHMGYGIGFRYITPVGPIRFDLAQGDTYRYLHFGLGQLF